ncbi:uncharacterized protein LOC126978277 [Leptidea sinapis]|uniref:uncharacterized protein LOC126978277 n=1 Tax=Leptidea sinapis TaxID=189913 RepID=UPI002120A4D5|nr:uncharacterized protein LOC126978277 [Leptidea sinapis]
MVVLFIICVLIARTMCHTITQMDVPRWADPRIDAQLKCQYTRQPGDPGLHSVKWYRGKHEIFRFMPQEYETRSFNNSGISVTNSSCDMFKCVISVRPDQGTAVYTCEVSSEGPRFAVDRRSANMTLAVLPEYEPLITGLPTIVQAGQQAFVNCTSDYSLPASHIEWFIDGELQEDPIITENTHVSGADGDGLQASWRTLHVFPDDYSTHRGFLSLECRSTVPTRPVHVRSMAVRLFIASRPHISSFMLSKNNAVSGCNAVTSNTQEIFAVWTILVLLRRQVP